MTLKEKKKIKKSSRMTFITGMRGVTPFPSPYRMSNGEEKDYLKGKTRSRVRLKFLGLHGKFLGLFM